MYYTLRNIHGNFIVEKKKMPAIFARKKLEKWVDEKDGNTYYSKNPIDLQSVLNKEYEKKAY